MSNSESLMLETLETLQDYTKKMIQGIDNFIKYISKGKEGDALQILSDIMLGLDWIVQAAVLTRPIQKEILNEQDLLKQIAELIDAYENKDFVLVSDILDYEIKPILEKWVNQIH